MAQSPTIDAETCCERLKAFYASFQATFLLRLKISIQLIRKFILCIFVFHAWNSVRVWVFACSPLYIARTRRQANLLVENHRLLFFLLLFSSIYIEFDGFQKSGAWNDVECFAVTGGARGDEAIRYSKPIALYLWLFGYEVPDTLLVFAKDAVHMVVSVKRGGSFFQ